MPWQFIEYPAAKMMCALRGPRVYLLLMISMLMMTASSQSLWALEFESGVAASYWRYQESSGAVTGLTQTPFHSSGSGYGLSAKLALLTAIDDDWRFSSTVSGMLPINSLSETWALPNASVQKNQLAIEQGDVRMDLLRCFEPVCLGLWGSYRSQLQKRQQFYINGVLQPNGLIEESVQTAWAGLSLQSESEEHLLLSLDIGVPVWVKTTNTNAPGISWHTKKGAVVDVKLDWPTPWRLGGAGVLVNVAYHYQVLGGELVQGALWPKNHFQQLTLGLDLRW
ncbi:MAG: hypothetical protein Q9M31_06615 [Mariprofundus sp.]|nr:hypothetical protein [Mariprofundus sp.]